MSSFRHKIYLFKLFNAFQNVVFKKLQQKEGSKLSMFSIYFTCQVNRLCLYRKTNGLQRRVKINGEICNIFLKKAKIYNLFEIFVGLTHQISYLLCKIIILPSGHLHCISVLWIYSIRTKNLGHVYLVTSCGWPSADQRTSEY